MIKRIAIVAAAAAAIASALPVTTASAQDVGVAVGPGGVTVGAVGRDRYYRD